MKSDKMKFFLEDMTFNSKFEFFEEGKENNKIKEIASEKDIKIPSKDLALFSCKYAFVDKKNLNGCILQKKEVKKSLGTLNGKAIDKDHFRKSTVGFWLGAELEEETIIAYGAFWKANFPEEYEEIKTRMNEGTVSISFEAWGEREFIDESTYNLKELSFCGGALLFDTNPAFPGAEVMEFSKKREQVLEFAKVIEDTPKVEKETVQMEEAKLNFNYDNSLIARMMWEGKCASCETQGWFDVNKIDFDSDELELTCGKCGGKSKMKLTPQVTLMKKGKKVEKSSTQPEVKTSEKITDKGGCEVDEFLKKYNMASVVDMTKFVDEMSSSLTSKDKEIADLKKSVEEASLKVENAKIELEKVMVEAKTVKDQLDAKLAAEKASFVKARKDELGEEFAKDMTDEDISNDLKFENAKLKKELANVKKVQETASTKPTVGLEAGTKTAATKDPLFSKQENIQSKAFPKES